MGNGAGSGGFRGTSNGVIRLLAEIGAPLTMQGGLEPGERRLERARDIGMEGEREWERGLSFVYSSSSVQGSPHSGPTCQWGGHPSEL